MNKSETINIREKIYCILIKQNKMSNRNERMNNTAIIELFASWWNTKYTTKLYKYASNESPSTTSQNNKYDQYVDSGHASIPTKETQSK